MNIVLPDPSCFKEAQRVVGVLINIKTISSLKLI
jgi:hypothetical protein